MVAMAKGARHGADATQFANELFVIGHNQDVHITRTPVNVESVWPPVDNALMAETETIGEALARLRNRSGLSMKAFAEAAGYSAASGVQRYLEASFNKPLSVKLVERFAEILVGKGTPPIERPEVLALGNFPVDGNATTFRMEGAGADRMTKDVPVYGTALGADEIVDGDAIEQTSLNTAETVGWFRRPVLLDGRADIYGLYVQGSSMAPRFRDGATLFVEQRKLPKIGDDAVIYLRRPDEHDGERPSVVLIKTLVRKTANFIELEQYTPPLIFRIPTERVMRMDRVVPWDELVD